MGVAIPLASFPHQNHYCAPAWRFCPAYTASAPGKRILHITPKVPTGIKVQAYGSESILTAYCHTMKCWYYNKLDNHAEKNLSKIMVKPFKIFNDKPAQTRHSKLSNLPNKMRLTIHLLISGQFVSQRNPVTILSTARCYHCTVRPSTDITRHRQSLLFLLQRG